MIAIDPSWKCLGRSCPDRAPVFLHKAPKCYTCGIEMVMVSEPERLDSPASVARVLPMTTAEAVENYGFNPSSPEYERLLDLYRQPIVDMKVSSPKHALDEISDEILDKCWYVTRCIVTEDLRAAPGKIFIECMVHDRATERIDAINRTIENLSSRPCGVVWELTCLPA